MYFYTEFLRIFFIKSPNYICCIISQLICIPYFADYGIYKAPKCECDKYFFTMEFVKNSKSKCYTTIYIYIYYMFKTYGYSYAIQVL